MDKRLQTVTFQLDVELFDQLWKVAKVLGISIAEIARQAVLIWLSQHTVKEVSDPEGNKDKDDAA